MEHIIQVGLYEESSHGARAVKTVYELNMRKALDPFQSRLVFEKHLGSAAGIRARGLDGRFFLIQEGRVNDSDGLE